MEKKLRFLGGRYQGRVVDLIDNELTIGRGNANKLTIDQDGISRNHCRIVKENADWFVEDLGSTNGVRVNGTRIGKRQKLQLGDRLGIGSSVLLFTDSSDIVNPDELSHDQSAPVNNASDELSEPSAAAAVPAAGEVAERERLPWARLMLLILVITATIYVGVNVEQGQKQATDEQSQELVSEPQQFVADVDGTTGDGDLTLPPFSAPVDTQAGTRPDTATAAEAIQPEATRNVQSFPFMVMSVPDGAAVTINDKAYGKTPVLIKGLQPGRHMLKLSADGYEVLTRHLHMPDMLPEAPYVLRQNIRTLRITTEPPGAAVVHGSQMLGISPVLVKDLPEGEHEFGLVMPGYKTAKEKGTISLVRGEELHVPLVSRLGSIAVVTSPGECSVYVDDALKGRTPPNNGVDTAPNQMVVRGLIEGEHNVKVEHVSGLVKQGRVLVVSGEEARCNIAFWIADTKVVMQDGTVKYGMLRERTAQGDIVLAETPKGLTRYLNPQIKEIIKLTADEIRQRIENLAPQDRDDSKTMRGREEIGG